MARARLVLVTVAAMLASSCTYARDRWNDAKDIFTVGVGEGLGAVARVGPIQTGVGATIDNIALANGEIAVGGFGICGLTDSSPERAVFLVRGVENDGAGKDRGKDYDVDHAVVPFHARKRPSAAYYTQIEVSGGALIAAHVGFNPGELLDFLLGFVGVDIYGDDAGNVAPPPFVDRPVTGD